jgi:hypothetical protein
MRYVNSRIWEHQREEAYRIYISESLRLLPQNKYIQKPYYEIIQPQTAQNVSGDEVAVDIITRAGLTFMEGG